MVYCMVLQGDTQYITHPGQFVEVELPGLYSRRPLSVCDWDETTLTLIYKVVVHRTDLISVLCLGTVLDFWL